MTNSTGTVHMKYLGRWKFPPAVYLMGMEYTNVQSKIVSYVRICKAPLIELATRRRSLRGSWGINKNVLRQQKEAGAEFITNRKEDRRVCVSPVYSEFQ